MANRRLLAGAAALAFLAAPGTALAQTDIDALANADVIAQEEAHEKLFALFADSDERNLELNPLSRLFRGDDTNADRLGDFFTDSAYYAQLRDTQLNVALLQQIDRSRLSATDKLAYDVFRYNQEQVLAASTPEIRALTEVRPINHFSGFHTVYPNFASGTGAAPFLTVANYEDNLSRHDDYIAATDRAIAKFREGMESGVVETKLTIGNVIEQFNTQLAIPVEESQFMGPVTMFPDGFSEADRARLTQAYRAKTQEIYAAHEKMRDFLRDEYLAAAREDVGLGAMKGGEELYALLIEQTTTLPLEADYIHQLGLSEVARIKGELEALKAEVGFEGTLAEFFDYVRTDAQFKPESREALTQNYYAIGEQVDAKIGNYFSLVPKTDLVIKPYDPSIEQFSAGGSYQSGTPDGSRPGTFFFNAYDLPSRLTTGNVTLYLHEGAGERGSAGLHALRRDDLLRRRLGAVRGDAGQRDGFLRRPLESLRHAAGRTAARNAAGGGYRAPFQGLDPRSGDRFHARKFGHDAHRSGRRGGTLHRHSVAGARLQDRRAEDPGTARPGAERAGRCLRHQGLPRTGAGHRRATAAGSGTEDRPLDRRRGRLTGRETHPATARAPAPARTSAREGVNRRCGRCSRLKHMLDWRFWFSASARIKKPL